MATTCNGQVLEGIVRGQNFRLTGLDPTLETGLVQGFSLMFQRKLSRIYELTSTSFYYIEGPSEGTVDFTKIIGPKGAPKISCDCTPRTLTLSLGPAFCFPSTGKTDETITSYTLSNALPYGLKGGGTSNDYIVAFNLSFLFSNIE